MRALKFIFGLSIAVHSAIILMWMMIAVYSGMEDHYMKQLAARNGLISLSNMSLAELGQIRVRRT